MIGCTKQIKTSTPEINMQNEIRYRSHAGQRHASTRLPGDGIVPERVQFAHEASWPVVVASFGIHGRALRTLS